MSKIKKTPVSHVSKSGIRHASPDDAYLKFSFKLFDCSDEDVCPPIFMDGYTQALMDRLKSLSGWTAMEFTSNRSAAIRSHKIDWEKTSKPEGFAALNEQYQAYDPWQFSLSANKFGRVHGIIIGACFYIIWLDANHKVYE